jgi:hypothetical protein
MRTVCVRTFNEDHERWVPCIRCCSSNDSALPLLRRGGSYRQTARATAEGGRPR